MKKPDVLHISTLSGDWCDKDVVMLHACFQLLSDCIKKEKLLTGNTDWNYTTDSKNAKLEIEALYEWWTKRKKQDNPVYAVEEARYEEDNEMLIRLIKIRKHLWT